MSDRFDLPQQGPGLLHFHAVQAGVAQQELAQLVKDESGFGMTAPLAKIVRRLYIYSCGFAR